MAFAFVMLSKDSASSPFDMLNAPVRPKVVVFLGIFILFPYQTNRWPAIGSRSLIECMNFPVSYRPRSSSLQYERRHLLNATDPGTQKLSAKPLIVPGGHLKLHGVELSGGRPKRRGYSLRHCVISELVHGGLELLTVAQISGTSVAMFEKHYGHLRTDLTVSSLAGLTLLCWPGQASRQGRTECL